MGKKNKSKNNNGDADKKEAQQEKNPNAAPSNKSGQEQQKSQQGQTKQQQNPQQGSSGRQHAQQQQGSSGGGQQNPQQGAWGGQKPKQQQNPQQGAWGGQQNQQQQNPQQGARGGQQPKQQQNPQQGAWGGQQGARGEQQPKQQQNPQQGARGGQQNQQQGGQQNPQQGVWGGQQPRQQQNPQQGGRGGQQNPQQGTRGGQQNPQQGTRGGQQNPQQGARGGQQNQPQQNPQQGGWRGQQQQSSSGREHPKQQQGSWGGGQDRQQQNPQHGAGDGRQHTQQRNPHGAAGQQQRSRDQHFSGGDQSRQQQQVHGRPQQQELARLPISNENPLPVKEKSCNGIARGTLGSPGTVEVNYLRLDLGNMPDEAYHYDITITPDRPKKFLRPAFEQFRLEVYPDILVTFDGLKNCYSMQRLNTPIERTINVLDTGNRTKEFKVLIKETDSCVVDLKSLRNYQNERIFDKPMRALQVLEVVLASNNHQRGIRVGRSFFRRPVDAFYLEDGYEAWTGLYQAAILGEMPLLNVDIAHKSFPCESTLLEYLDKMGIDKNNDLSASYSFRDICSFLKGITITYTPPASFGAPPKQYKILAVGEPASRKTFKTDDGKEMTVANYFRSRGLNLRYPNLNCLNVGSTVRQISLPMELCSIVKGQALNRKDQSRQVEKMVRYAATSTNTRKQKIMDLLTYFDHNVNPIIRGFGLSVGSSFLKVPMRMLPSPALEYLQGQTVTTFKGAWRMDGKRFLICPKPQNGHKWAILYEEITRGRTTSYHDLEGFRTDVIKTSQSLNMGLQPNAEIISYKYNQLQSTLKDLADKKFDLVFVVLNDRGTPYAKIKQTAELQVGILTQCIKDKTVFRTARDRTVFSNILLKVNGKLNGTNHKIAQERGSNLLAPINNVMYLGADVTHPSPDQREIPSVVGVAASHDQYGACYNCQYRLQRSTVENIEDMESIATRHLEVYNKYQKRLPDQIIYYRDGVSDGQFPIVEREEIRAIKRACAKMRCNPKMTCVIVVKRHHTRFFPMKQPDNDRDFNNVQAGTVVDQYITHPNEVQFFMVSHQSIQGTARPTRYNVIMNESNFDINLLQKLTYNLCHLFPRCNRAVSYPAPAYLAHLVAFRGRVYLEGTQRFDSNLKREYDKRLIKPDFINKNPMYFI